MSEENKIEQPQVENPAEEKHMRTVKSFVLRAGRMTEGQQKAMDDVWPSMGLELNNGLLDFNQVFGREAPVVLEIGFGMGDSLVEMAKDQPEKTTSALKFTVRVLAAYSVMRKRRPHQYPCFL